jgi:hypothetical protein
MTRRFGSPLQNDKSANPAPVVVSAELFALVAPYKAVHDIRYYLNGISIKPFAGGGVIVCATDGHQLAMAHDATGHADAEYIVPITPQLIAAARSKDAYTVELGEARKENDPPPLFADGPNARRITVRDGVWRELYVSPAVGMVDGKFHDFVKVLPKSADELQPGALGFVRGKYLSRIGATSTALEAQRDIYGSGVCHWSKKAEGDLGAIYTRFYQRPDLLLITMPMRCEKVPPLPTFVEQMVAAGQPA